MNIKQSHDAVLMISAEIGKRLVFRPSYEDGPGGPSGYLTCPDAITENECLTIRRLWADAHS